MISVDNKEYRLLFDRTDTTFLRGLSILAIVIHHIYQFTSYVYGITYPSALNLLFSSFGYMGVSVFFMLSGYGLTCSVKKNAPITKTYIISHLTKLIEPFIYVWILDLLFFYTSPNESLINLISLSLSNNELWFLKEIFILYLLYLLPFIIYRNHSQAIIIPLLLSTIFAIIVSFIATPSYWWNSTLCFPLGILCSLRKDNIDLIYKKHRYSLCFLFAVLFTVSYFLSYHYILVEILRSISFAILAILLVTFRKHRISCFEILSAESLKIYIFHVFLLQFCTKVNYLLFIALIIFGTAALVYSYNLIYKNLSHWLMKRSWKGSFWWHIENVIECSKNTTLGQNLLIDSRCFTIVMTKITGSLE